MSDSNNKSGQNLASDWKTTSGAVRFSKTSPSATQGITSMRLQESIYSKKLNNGYCTAFTSGDLSTEENLNRKGVLRDSCMYDLAENIRIVSSVSRPTCVSTGLSSNSCPEGHPQQNSAIPVRLGNGAYLPPAELEELSNTADKNLDVLKMSRVLFGRQLQRPDNSSDHVQSMHVPKTNPAEYFGKNSSNYENY